MEIYATDHGIGGLVMPEELSKIICDYARPQGGFKEGVEYFYQEGDNVGCYITLVRIDDPYPNGTQFCSVKYSRWYLYGEDAKKYQGQFFATYHSPYRISFFGKYEDENLAIFSNCTTCEKKIQKAINTMKADDEERSRKQRLQRESREAYLDELYKEQMEKKKLT